MKNNQTFIIIVACLFLVACTSSTCPPDTISYLSQPYPLEDLDHKPQPQLVEIGRKQIEVDEVISGPLCNDSWTGTIFVTCDLQIPEWDKESEQSLFFQDCDLMIEEDTIVYVEAHGSQPYYQGCSCHEIAE